MRKSLLTIAAAALLASAGIASAQTTTTTTTWTNEQGPALRTYSTTESYKSYSDPALRPSIGMELPTAVTVYPLPPNMKVQNGDTYSYGIVNENPVIVERSTRKIIHTWP